MQQSGVRATYGFAGRRSQAACHSNRWSLSAACVTSGTSHSPYPHCAAVYPLGISSSPTPHATSRAEGPPPGQQCRAHVVLNTNFTTLTDVFLNRDAWRTVLRSRSIAPNRRNRVMVSHRGGSKRSALRRYRHNKQTCHCVNANIIMVPRRMPPQWMRPRSRFT